jgi:hypothetical protein
MVESIELDGSKKSKSVAFSDIVDQESEVNQNNDNILKYGINNLIGYGTFIKNRLRKNDVYRSSIDGHKKIFISYQVICCLIIHFSLIANLATVIYYLYDFWKNGEIRKLSQSIILFLIYLTSVFAYDLSFYYRKTTTSLVNDICDEEFINDRTLERSDKNNLISKENSIENKILNFKEENKKNEKTSTKDNKSNDENIWYLKVYFIFRDYILKPLKINKLMILFTFIPPLICIITSIGILIYNIIKFKWTEIEYSFFFFNTGLIFFKVIFHIIVTLLLIIKFIALNKSIQKLINDKNTTVEELENTIRW